MKVATKIQIAGSLAGAACLVAAAFVDSHADLLVEAGIALLAVAGVSRATKRGG